MAWRADSLELLTHLASAAGTSRATDPAPPSAFEHIRDAQSGRSYLKIRMPEPEASAHRASGTRCKVASVTKRAR